MEWAGRGEVGDLVAAAGARSHQRGPGRQALDGAPQRLRHLRDSSRCSASIPKAPAIPQQPVSSQRGEAPGSRPSRLTTRRASASAFAWQWPWTATGPTGPETGSASGSRSSRSATKSSKSTARAATSSAPAIPSCRYSSTNIDQHEGSRNTTGSTDPRKSPMLWTAARRTSSSTPRLAAGRPQHTRPATRPTSKPAASSTATAARPTSGSW